MRSFLGNLYHKDLFKLQGIIGDLQFHSDINNKIADEYIYLAKFNLSLISHLELISHVGNYMVGVHTVQSENLQKSMLQLNYLLYC